MKKERQSIDTQLRKIEQDYSIFFGKPCAPQQTEVARQGCFTQFTAYENVQVSYAATTGR
ncbi:hypothetical protein GMI70_09920 [Eggerthellaceae bacterium zg-893]|nr:hypothetical protein [Eggerthellaceae bacterium zg-893]